VGTWAEPGVQCEACHGPGGLHAQNPYGSEMKIDRDAAACGQCHLRGDSAVVAVEAGFIQHDTQYEDLHQSKHLALDCVQCHDPHTGVVQQRATNQPAVRTACADCHYQEAAHQKNDRHILLNVQCQACHMPRLIQSAWGDPARFTGDVRSHVMAIDVSRLGQFDEAGATAEGHIALDYACRGCHLPGTGAELTDEALIEAATDYHTRP
jgi:predicted CXXCH cytochrome family protein